MTEARTPETEARQREQRRRGLDPLRTILGVVLYPAVLFGCAGTLRWAEGWVFLGLVYTFTLVLYLVLKRHDPELLASRTGPMFREGQALWDKVWLATFVLTGCAWLVLASLDGGRFGWSRVPTWLTIVGGLVFGDSLVALYLVFRANTFLSPVVEIQAERGQKLVDSGPYAIVRHPMYAVLAALLVAGSLLLGSWYALGLAALLVVMLGVRTFHEERALREGLEGYVEYTQRVRFRMIPWVW